MKRLILLLPAIAVLAGCDSKPEVSATNASMSDVAAKARKAVQLEPGKWQLAVKVVSVDAPGLPAAAVSAMKKQIAAMGTQTVEQCLTPEMAAKPPENMFTGAAKNCTYEKFEMAGGKLDGTLVCKGGAGGMPGDLRSTMSGTFSSTGYTVVSDSQMSMPAMPGATAGGKISTRTEVNGKRLGTCDAPKGV